MIRILVIFLLFFLYSCTTPSHNLIKVTRDEDIYYVSERLNDSCLASENPQFLTEFSSFESGTDFQLEGVWKNNYKVLNMQVLGPFGEQYVYLELNDHKINVFSSRKNILGNPEIKSLIHFISSLGSLELRQLFCGSYAFNSEKNIENIFIKNEIIPHTESFFTKKNTEIDGHAIEIQSDLNLADIKDTEAYELKINSKFLYGFFSSDTNLKVQWVGNVDDENIIPKFIHLNYEKSNYELRIMDYN